MPVPACFGASGLSMMKNLASQNNDGDGESKEKDAQHNRDPKQDSFNPAAGSKYTAGIGTGQAAQACALAL